MAKGQVYTKTREIFVFFHLGKFCALSLKHE